MKNWKLLLIHCCYSWGEQRNIMREEVVMKNLTKDAAIKLRKRYNKLTAFGLFKEEKMNY